MSGTQRRVKFDESSCRHEEQRQQKRRFQRPSPFDDNDGMDFDVSVPSDVRRMLGSEPAVMMPVPLSWGAAPNGEQKYLRQMYPSIPEAVRRDLDFDFGDSLAGGSSGIPCRFCGMEFGQSALLHHQAKCKTEMESSSADRLRGAERGYLIRNWYSSSHPLKRLERSHRVRECRYCRAPVPLHILSQHEDECRSVMYGTAPNGY